MTQFEKYLKGLDELTVALAIIDTMDCSNCPLNYTEELCDEELNCVTQICDFFRSDVEE